VSRTITTTGCCSSSRLSNTIFLEPDPGAVLSSQDNEPATAIAAITSSILFMIILELLADA
jgi:hypothetical protein